MGRNIYTDGERAYSTVSRDEGFDDWLQQEVHARLGLELSLGAPAAATAVRRIAEIALAPVDDLDAYELKPIGKPAVGAAPSGKPGEWAIQSLIFSRDQFDLAGAKRWIAEHEGFADHGADETSSSFRFRQYDPEHFSTMRTIAITDGVSGVYGRIKEAAKGDAAGQAKADAEAALDALLKRHEAVRQVTAGVLARGVRALSETATIRKAQDGTEERYILGLVLEPNDGADGAPYKPDTQQDIYSAEDVRRTAHGWMEHYGHVDLMHSWKALGAGDVSVLESYLAPCDFDIAPERPAAKAPGDKKPYHVCKGTWLLALRVLDDEVWQQIKNHEIGAYSIGGRGQREPVAGEPPAKERTP